MPYCCSSGSFEIAKAENVSRGTKVVIHLKEDHKNFSLNTTVEGEMLLEMLLLTININ